MNRHSENTIQYYDDHAEGYARSTVGIEFSSLYEPFLRMVPKGGRILDAGCGSGRDAKAFLDLGYNVIAIDASERMAMLASQLIGPPVSVMRFQEMSYDQAFDGVWACASLLHVPRPEIAGVIDRMARSLRLGGVLYASFKQGERERLEGVRLFNDMTEGQIEQVFSGFPSLSIVRIWITADIRPERVGEQWVNVLVRKHN